MKSNPFRFKQFVVDDDTSSMKVGTDAVLLGSWASPPASGKILDIGTGSGVIALMMAQKSEAYITAIDIHEPSIAQAEKNFVKSPWGNRIKAINISLELFADSCNQKFDFIISNPPFFINSLKPKKERLTLAKHTNDSFIDNFTNDLCRLLNPSGKIALIIPGQPFPLVAQKLKALSLFPSRIAEVRSRPCTPLSRVMVEFEKNNGANCSMESIFIRGDDRRYTDEYIVLTRDFYLFLNE